jgi:excisionase family DNA binding protein
MQKPSLADKGGVKENDAGQIGAVQMGASGGPQGMKTQASAPTFFTERSLADYLAVSDRTVRNWIRRGELPSYKLGASRRIDPADVAVFLEQRREAA